MFFPYLDYVVYDVPAPSDGSDNIIVTLGYKALVQVEFYGDMDGSQLEVYGVFPPNTGFHGGIANVNKASTKPYVRQIWPNTSQIRLQAANFGGGVTSARIHVLRLPEG